MKKVFLAILIACLSVASASAQSLGVFSSSDEEIELKLDYMIIQKYLTNCSSLQVIQYLENEETENMIYEVFSEKKATPEQISAALLYADYLGMEKFRNSEFFQVLSTCGWLNAGAYLTNSKTSKADKKQLWIMEALWNGDLQMGDFMGFPGQTFRNLKVKKIYPSGKYFFSGDLYLNLIFEK